MGNTDTSDPSVFKYWSELAVSDPERFELERKAIIDEFIASVPEHLQPKLKRLQLRVEIERVRAISPLDSCSRIGRMMVEEGLNRLLDEIIELRLLLDLTPGDEGLMGEAKVLALLKKASP